MTDTNGNSQRAFDASPNLENETGYVLKQKNVYKQDLFKKGLQNFAQNQSNKQRKYIPQKISLKQKTAFLSISQTIDSRKNALRDRVGARSPRVSLKISKNSILSGQGDPTDPRHPYIKANNTITSNRERRQRANMLSTDQFDTQPKNLSTSISRENVNNSQKQLVIMNTNKTNQSVEGWKAKNMITKNRFGSQQQVQRPNVRIQQQQEKEYATDGSAEDDSIVVASSFDDSKNLSKRRTNYPNTTKSICSDTVSAGFSQNISANTLRNANHKFSFGGKGVSRQINAGMQSIDAFYDLPSTLNTKGAHWANRTEQKDNSQILKAQPGHIKFPAANHYPVKRLYDDISLDSRNNKKRLQTVDAQSSILTERRESPERCTFGIPYEAYRNVIIGSHAFLDGKNYRKESKAPNTTACKQRVILDGKKQRSPSPGQYETKSALKSQRFTFGKALRSTNYIAQAVKKSEHSPPPNTYCPNHVLTEPQKFSKISIGKGIEYHKQKKEQNNMRNSQDHQSLNEAKQTWKSHMNKEQDFNDLPEIQEHQVMRKKQLLPKLN